MAGFQQAANALTGAYGTVAGRVGIYSELVGKNQELIKKTQAQNEELEKKNKTINFQKESMAVGDELISHYMKGSLNLYMRNMEHERARASRDIMLDVVYGEKPATTAVPNVKSKEGGK